MSNIKLGWICSILQIVLSVVSWTIFEKMPNNTGSAFLIIFSVVSILMWYEAIRIAMKESIKEGLKVSGFFLIHVL